MCSCLYGKKFSIKSWQLYRLIIPKVSSNEKTAFFFCSDTDKKSRKPRNFRLLIAGLGCKSCKNLIDDKLVAINWLQQYCHLNNWLEQHQLIAIYWSTKIARIFVQKRRIFFIKAFKKHFCSYQSILNTTWVHNHMF